jgi:membrane protease subunit (stomatin/prohibitin family)
MVVSRFANILGQAKIPALDLAGNYDQLGQFLLQRIAPEFEAVGLELTNLLVENISLPKEVEAVLDKRTSMGIVGNLDQYTQFQAAEAMRDAAANPGGGSDAMNMGLGSGDGPTPERNAVPTRRAGADASSPGVQAAPGRAATVAGRQSLLRGAEQPAGRAVSHG